MLNRLRTPLNEESRVCAEFRDDQGGAIEREGVPLHVRGARGPLPREPYSRTCVPLLMPQLDGLIQGLVRQIDLHDAETHRDRRRHEGPRLEPLDSRQRAVRRAGHDLEGAREARRPPAFRLPAIMRESLSLLLELDPTLERTLISPEGLLAVGRVRRGLSASPRAQPLRIRPRQSPTITPGS